MVIPGQPTYPFQWVAILTNGLSYFVENGEQSDMRKAPGTIRELRIKGFNLSIPFVIPIPLGADPVFYRSGSMSVAGGGAGESLTHLGYTFCYGWEKGSSKRVWEFGGNPPILREFGPNSESKTEGIDLVAGSPVTEGTKIILP